MNPRITPGRRAAARGPIVPSWLIPVLLAAFVLAALLTAYLTYAYVRSLVADTIGAPSLPVGLATPPPAGLQLPSVKNLNDPLQDASGPTPEAWNGSGRVNILFMGLDYRQNQDGPSRTDTMILLTLDPATRTAGMLSIPRDLWVDIPGYGYSKINTAYFYGEADKIPGGGPGLAVKTVENFLGIPINYYAQVDFNSFVGFIDELGGVEITVPEEMDVDPLGPGNTVHLQPGKQMLDGATALAYARNRETAGSDFDRAQRQQQVIMAVRDRILSLHMLQPLIQKSPILYQQLAQGVHTNLSLKEILSLAWTASQIPPENIRKGIIGPDLVDQTFSYDGQSILQPKTDEIRALRDSIFTDTGPAVPAATAVNVKQLMAAEHAQVSVLNGTPSAGLASRTSTYLGGQGLQVTLTDNAQESYTHTTIIDYTGKIYTIKYLAGLMNISDAQIYHSYDPNSKIDIAVILGDDWAANNKMP